MNQKDFAKIKNTYFFEKTIRNVMRMRLGVFVGKKTKTQRRNYSP